MQPSTPDTRPPITTTFMATSRLREIAQDIDKWRAEWLPGIAEVEERLCDPADLSEPTDTDRLAEALGQVRDDVWFLIGEIHDGATRRNQAIVWPPR